MHSLHCIEVARTLRQVSVSDVPSPQKTWASNVYATAVTKLEFLNERGLHLAGIIDTYAQAWNSFVQHGDEHCLREPTFSGIVGNIIDANERLITEIRKDVKLSIKENGPMITRHSGPPGKECGLRCALVIPESRETRQIREQVLGWTMKDYCYHHPLKSLLSKSSLPWRQLEYAASLLKLLLLTQIHAEFTFCGIPLDVKAERHKQLEAIHDLTEKQQRLSLKEAKEMDTSSHYGNPIGVLNVSDLHPLPLSITVSRWFTPRRGSTTTTESLRAAIGTQQVIQRMTGASAEQTGLVMNELNTLKARYAELMQKTNDLVVRLSNQPNIMKGEVITSTTTVLADAVHNYIFSNNSSSHSRSDVNPIEALSYTSDSCSNTPELEGLGKQETNGSNHYPIEKTADTSDTSRRSSIWGLEDACIPREGFHLAGLENHRRRSSTRNIEHVQDGSQETVIEGSSSSPAKQVGGEVFDQQKIHKSTGNEKYELPIYELAGMQVSSQSFDTLKKFELSPIGSLLTDNMWMSEILLVGDPLLRPT